MTFLETRRAFNNGRMFKIGSNPVTMMANDYAMCGSIRFGTDAVFVETPPDKATHIGMSGYYHWNGRAVLKYKPRSNSWSHTSWHKEELDNADHFEPIV